MRDRSMISFWVLAALTHVQAGQAATVLLGTASVPGAAVDFSNLTDVLAGGVPHNRLGSFGSGIAYSGRDDLYYATDDRGPADGAVAFHCRVQSLQIH